MLLLLLLLLFREALAQDNTTVECKDCLNSQSFWCQSSSLCSTNFFGDITNNTCSSGWVYSAIVDDICEAPCTLTGQLWPCSDGVFAQLLMLVLYGIVLSFSAKTISDGSELLLEVLDPGLIGGLLLPVLGAVPDAAIIIVSGAAASSAAEAQYQLNVGVGTLAGSTVMLLTVPWVGCLLFGRTDIRDGESVDETLSEENYLSVLIKHPKEAWRILSTTGITVDNDTLWNARIMLASTSLYFIIQGIAFGYLRTPDTESAKNQESQAALAGFIFCSLAVIAYCVFQVANPKLQAAKMKEARARALKNQVVHQFLSAMVARKPVFVNSESSEGVEEQRPSETTPLTTQKPDVLSLGRRWKAKARASAVIKEQDSKDIQTESSDVVVLPVDEEPEEPKEEKLNKNKIVVKATILLVLGTLACAVFSDPMVEVIGDLAVNRHIWGGENSAQALISFYISFIITPFCSNASELISSLVFSTAKKQQNNSLSYSQMYGAALMNNTLCLGIFYALIYFKDLAWTFSSEVLPLMVVLVVIGIVGSFKRTFPMWTMFPVISLYPLALIAVGILEQVAGWTM